MGRIEEGEEMSLYSMNLQRIIENLNRDKEQLKRENRELQHRVKELESTLAALGYPTRN